MFYSIYQIYTQYLIRKWFALVTDNQPAYTHAVKHLIRIERMYGSDKQDNFYHYRAMIKNWFARVDGKWAVK